VTGAERDVALGFEALLHAWERGDPAAVLGLVTETYVGHMLHLVDGERTAAEYPAWIARWRESNPGTIFEVADQGLIGSTLWTRLVAHRPDGSSANGMNESRFEGELVAEEWAVWSGWH
jgi:hypothetical protein